MRKLKIFIPILLLLILTCPKSVSAFVLDDKELDEYQQEYDFSNAKIECKFRQVYVVTMTYKDQLLINTVYDYDDCYDVTGTVIYNGVEYAAKDIIAGIRIKYYYEGELQLEILTEYNHQRFTTTVPVKKAYDISVEKATKKSITVTKFDDAEYSIDGGETWQDSNKFKKLKRETDYTILIRDKTENNDSVAIQEIVATTK